MSNIWMRLSSRERWLALATLAVIAGACAVGLGIRAVDNIRTLDRTIARMEQDLVNFKKQEARGVSVDKLFVDVAAQHSSAWTEAEIHNRLRQEIYRQAQEDPDSPPETSKKLVDIPTLRQGTLKDGGAGYREYQLQIKIPSSDVYSIIIFLIRLQQSAQTLRIEGLDITRSPDSQLVAASINVTRTIVSGSPDAAPPEEGGEVPEQKAPQVLANWEGDRTEDWKADGCELSMATEIGEQSADGGSCLKAASSKPGATAYMVHDLDAGVTYDLTLTVLSECEGGVGIVDDASSQAYDGSQLLPADGKNYRYHLQFTVTGESGSKMKVRAPVISLKENGCQVYVDNITLKKAGE